MNKNSRIVAGQSLPRIDGEPKVNGRHVYASDIALPGMLTGRLVRSTIPHGRLLRLDTSKALAMTGVYAVITASDLEQVKFGILVKDQTLFAEGVVRYVGQPIAAVAAATPEIAERAAAAIEVEYEPLPGIFEIGDALKPDAACIHDDWKNYEASPIVWRDGNVTNRASMAYGDVEAGFRDSYRVYEHTFTTPLQHAGYTEPRTAVAAWDSNGMLTIWSNAQLPFEVQAVVAEVLQIEPSRVRIVVPGIGGGFGGKLRIGMEHYAAALARHCGRPVRIACTAEEELIAAHPRQAAIVTLKTGVDRNGRILARSGQAIIDCGANAGSGPSVAANALQVLAGPYVVPNLDLVGLSVYTNKVPSGSFRAPSGPMANLAVECQMDMIARDLGIDPLELRLANVFHEGDLGPAGEVLSSVSIEECLRRAAEAIGWHDKPTEKNRGKGIACGWWLVAGGSSGAYLRLNGDGTVTLTSGAVEIGTGAFTGIAQILAEELGIELTDVRIAIADTQNAPFDMGSQGSRTLFNVGNACRVAAEDFRKQVFDIVAKHYDGNPAQMVLRDKSVVFGERRIPLAEIAKIANMREGGIIARGQYINPAPAYDASRVKHHTLPAWSSPSFFAHAIDVSVDPDTGEITINDYVAVHDVGFAVNPTYVEGQIEGGVVQALGLALSEEIVYKDGYVQNPNLTDYKMPTAQDAPEIRCILVESPSAAGPYGVKGIGEPPCICPPAAIANAIADATGQWMQSLPITAEKLARKIRHKAD